jgi:hypothetical protein
MKNKSIIAHYAIISVNIFLFFSLHNIITGLYAQCPDARAKSYLDKTINDPNVQSCSQCAALAAYLCSAKYCATQEDINKLRGLINSIKSNITYMGAPICCSELLNENPQYGIYGLGNSNNSNGNSSGENKSTQQYDAKRVAEWKDDPNKAINSNNDVLNSIAYSNIDVTSISSTINGVFKTISSINTIYTDPLDKFRDVIANYRYEWEVETDDGEGKGNIIYNDSNYVFSGDIKRGIATNGKLLLANYGVYKGEFSPPTLGGTPLYGVYTLNFGTIYNYNRNKVTEKIDIYYVFENGDSAIFYSKGIIPMIKYHQKSGKIYNIPELQFMKMKPNVKELFPYDQDKNLRTNYAKLLLARSMKALAKNKIIGIRGFSDLEIGGYNTVFKTLSELKKMDIEEDVKWWIENLFKDLEIKE